MSTLTSILGAAHRSRPYTVGEEIANSVVHGVGIALSLAGLLLLTIAGAQSGSAAALAGGIVFGVALVLEYTASTLYHAIPNPRAKHVFKVLDHAGIYLLIAGSYTPFTLVTLAGPMGWWLFAAIWGLAGIGIATEAFWAYRPQWLSVAVYLFMGWMVVFAIKPLAAALPTPALWLLVAGGLAYTAGTPFYIFKRIPYFHFVWHFFVLAGSVLHFFAILLFVIMPA